ncbi:MAG: hypothetical protein C4540_02445 [Candidatus Omnitrophota bacterium]|jgi:hypothetical protein|nr:MAG: hypothetical protein C4540_02445 [Candidatus Omnitrophota bacterium]
MAIITDTKFNFEKAENDLFSWNYWDGTSGNCLTHKPSGREIYQMRWNNGEEVESDIRQAAKEFWTELWALQEQKPPRIEEDYDYDLEPKHGQNGYCRKCGSYCYGDCEAN